MASVNDLQSRAWKRSTFAGAGTTNAAIAAGTRIHVISVSGGSGASFIKVYNAATVTGTDFITINALTSDYKCLSLGQNGTVYDVGVTVVVSGTGAAATIFYSVD